MEESGTRTQSFRCSQCDGKMVYDPASRTLVCDHCGYSKTVPRGEGRRAIVDYDLESGLATARKRGYGAPVHTSQCQECGASVHFADHTTATECDFCGSTQVLEREENSDLLRPESLVPFRISRDQAGQTFAGWLGKLWFRPSDLKRRAQLAEMSGVYVPYWSFAAAVQSDWTAEAGYHYHKTQRYVEEDDAGNVVTKTRQVRRTRWRPAWGSRRDSFREVLICASRGLPEKLERKLWTFDTSELLPYEPIYLAGWRAEEYAVELNDGWRRAVARMESVQARRCAWDVPGDTHRFLHVTNTFSDQTFKHILLPIWISSYRYGNNVYRFLINGQSGEITGKAPLSKLKVGLFSLAAIAIVAVIVIVVRMYR